MARRLLIPALLCCLALVLAACDGAEGTGQGSPPEDDDTGAQTDGDGDAAAASDEDAAEVLTAAARTTLDAGTARTGAMLTRDVQERPDDEETDVSPADIQAWTALDMEEDFAADRRRIFPGPRAGVGAESGQVIVDGDTVLAARGTDDDVEWHAVALEGLEGDVYAGLRFPFRDSRMVLEMLAAGVEDAEALASEDEDEAADGDEGSHWYRTQLHAGDDEQAAWLDLVSGGEPLTVQVRLDAAREVVTAAAYESVSDDVAGGEVTIELAYEVDADVAFDMPDADGADDSTVVDTLRVILRAGGGEVGTDTSPQRDSS
jgi:hypothetical protein